MPTKTKKKKQDRVQNKTQETVQNPPMKGQVENKFQPEAVAPTVRQPHKGPTHND